MTASGATLRMIAKARAVRAHSWSPYSRFKVGACVRDERGRLHAGCNVENAAYPQGTCAEAGAIAAMVAAGGRQILECVVVGGGNGPCAPCGGCRQKLAEFMPGDAILHMADPRGRILESRTLSELQPLAFGRANMKA
jgi:cytidine deaminase